MPMFNIYGILWTTNRLKRYRKNNFTGTFALITLSVKFAPEKEKEKEKKTHNNKKQKKKSKYCSKNNKQFDTIQLKIATTASNAVAERKMKYSRERSKLKKKKQKFNMILGVLCYGSHH